MVYNKYQEILLRQTVQTSAIQKMGKVSRRLFIYHRLTMYGSAGSHTYPQLSSSDRVFGLCGQTSQPPRIFSLAYIVPRVRCIAPPRPYCCPSCTSSSVQVTVFLLLFGHGDRAKMVQFAKDFNSHTLSSVTCDSITRHEYQYDGRMRSSTDANEAIASIHHLRSAAIFRPNGCHIHTHTHIYDAHHIRCARAQSDVGEKNFRDCKNFFGGSKSFEISNVLTIICMYIHTYIYLFNADWPYFP